MLVITLELKRLRIALTDWDNLLDGRVGSRGVVEGMQARWELLLGQSQEHLKSQYPQ
jgi:hypothetical protein